MFDIEACQFVGYITKTIGFKGILQIKIENHFNTELFEETNSVFLFLNGLLVPFKIEELEFTPNTANIKLFRFDSIEQVQSLRGKKVYVKIDSKQKSQNPITSELESYIGYKIEDVKHGLIGEIIDFKKIPKNPIFEVKTTEKTIFIPANSVFFVKINNKKQVIKVNMPEGIYDI
ncbi:MAG: hypothetical protein GX879_05810 [Bacteroidales bacterium]|nr:hypothetical protein [Bacteroidales bacterium]